MIKNSSTLFRSVAILTFLYLGVMFWMFSFYPIKSVVDAYDRIPAEIRQGTTAPDPEADIIHLLPEQIKVVWAWSRPLAGFWLIAISIGATFSLLVGMTLGRKRVGRAKGTGEFRGMTVSIGRLGVPQLPQSEEIDGIDAHISLNKKEQAFADEVFAMLVAWKDHYAGDGHGVGLLDHTMNVVEKVVGDERADSTLFLIAASHDLGKITSFRRQGQGWVRTKLHAQESARLIALMDSWHELPERQREIIRLSVKYDHSPDLAAEYPEYRDDLKKYMSLLAEIDGRVTGEEKAQVIESMDLEEVAVETMLAHLHRGTFYQKNMPRGAESIGFRWKNRLYLYEGPLRKFLGAYVNKDLYAAAMSYRVNGNLSPFTVALLKGLAKRDMLVTRYEVKWGEGEACELPPEYALWDLDAWGSEERSKRWRAVIVLKTPASELNIAPPEAPFLKLTGFAPNKPNKARWIDWHALAADAESDPKRFNKLSDALPLPPKLDANGEPEQSKKAAAKRRKKVPAYLVAEIVDESHRRRAEEATSGAETPPESDAAMEAESMYGREAGSPDNEASADVIKDEPQADTRENSEQEVDVRPVVEESPTVKPEGEQSKDLAEPEAKEPVQAPAEPAKSERSASAIKPKSARPKSAAAKPKSGAGKKAGGANLSDLDVFK